MKHNKCLVSLRMYTSRLYFSCTSADVHEKYRREVFIYRALLWIYRALLWIHPRMYTRSIDEKYTSAKTREVYIRKSDLYIHKRALYIHKRAVQIMIRTSANKRREVYIRKSDLVSLRTFQSRLPRDLKMYGRYLKGSFTDV